MKSGGIARHLHLIPNFLSHALRQNKQDAMSAIRPLLARVCLSKIKFNSLWLENPGSDDPLDQVELTP